jgi:hypothetical protein
MHFVFIFENLHFTHLKHNFSISFKMKFLWMNLNCTKYSTMRDPSSELHQLAIIFKIGYVFFIQFVSHFPSY